MIHRQLMEEFQRWSEKENRKPLVLRGARQVGKTTLVDEFSKRYDVYIKLKAQMLLYSQSLTMLRKSTNIFVFKRKWSWILPNALSCS